MTSPAPDVTPIVRSWIRTEETADASLILAGVVAIAASTPQRRRRGLGSRFADFGAPVPVALVALVVVVVAVAVAGARSLPALPPGGTVGTPQQSPSAVPTPDGTLPAAWYRDVGSVGLPPEGATPSTPGPGVLVGQYTITSQPPFIGSAFLFADGRLIWNEHHTPVREGWWSTGWLEQRLTPEGLELAHELVTRTTAFPGPPAPPWMVLDPRALPSRLPPSAWADMTPRPYVPQRLAACLDFPESAATLTDVLSMLPTGARDLLDGRPLAVVPPTMESPPCLELRVADAHRLDSVLRNEGWDQDPRMNRLILEYHVAIEGEAPTWRLSVLFATVLPHGLVVMAIGG